jgi:hypothetical protein
MSSRFLSSAEIEIVRKFFQVPHLEIELRPNWGSSHSGFREELHGELKKKMAKAYPFSDSSIAHCRSLGGFAFTMYDSNHVISLGFDVEEDARVSKEIAARICKTAQEYAFAPSNGSLWTAKEACFKALKGPKQPQTVSGLELEKWEKWDSQIETVCLKDPRNFNYSSVKGLILKKTPYSLAFFIAFP